MPTILIGQNTKRVNSTKNSMSYVKTLSNCVLKEPCSMHSPVFQVQGLTKGKMYNYAKFENKYYWIDDIIYVTNDIQEIHCHLDPLGTFKTAINNTKAYCVYADGTHWNDEIDDVRFSPEREAPDQKVFDMNVFQGDGAGIPTVPATGGYTYIMNYIEQPPSAAAAQGIGATPVSGSWKCGINCIAVDSYALTYILGDLVGAVVDNIKDISMSANWTDYEIWQGIAKTSGCFGGSGSWRDNILSITAVNIPFSFFVDNSIGTAETAISVGGVPVKTSNLSVRVMPGLCFTVSGGYDLSLPWNDATVPASNGHKFLQNSRWASFQVYALGQMCQLDTSQLKNQSSVHINWCINLCTGEWNIRISEGTVGYSSSVTASKTLTIGRMGGTIGFDATAIAGNGYGAFEANAQTVSTLAPFVSSMIGVAAGGAAGAMTGAAIGNVISSFLPSGINPTPTPSGLGNNDMTSLFLTASNYFGRILIVGKQWKLNNNANYGWNDSSMPGFCDEYGYPCNMYLQLSTISGYVKCSGASVIGADEMTESDRSTINGYLNGSGVYLE